MSVKSQNGHRTATDEASGCEQAEPVLADRQGEIQRFGELIELPLGLSRGTREASVTALNHILADVMTLRDLYQKHHWQASGPTFKQLYELFAKHYQQQSALTEQIAQRIQ